MYRERELHAGILEHAYKGNHKHILQTQICLEHDDHVDDGMVTMIMTLMLMSMTMMMMMMTMMISMMII